MNKFKFSTFLITIYFLSITYYSCETESQPEINIDNIVFSANSFITAEGSINDFTAYVTPKDINLHLSSFSIQSSDESILTVSLISFKSGILTFRTISKIPGTVTLTLNVKNILITTTVTINKSNSQVIKILPTQINISDKIIFIFVNETYRFTTNIYPKNANDTTVSWVSIGDGIYIDANGEITPKKTGKFIVIASLNANPSVIETCSVFVNIKINSFLINNKNVILDKGEVKTLFVNILPVEVVDKNVIWKSDNNVVSINENGQITGVDYGIANINATLTSNIKFFDNAVVTVAVLKINKNNLTLLYGATENLTYTLLPNNLSNKTVTWKSDNEKVAKIDPQLGRIITISKGNANIIATASYHLDLVDTCKLNVYKAVESIKINYKNLTLLEGNIEKLTTIIYPSDAVDLSVSWLSTDINIATVDATTGQIKALKPGNVKIIATSNYGDKSIKDTCNLTVNPGKFGISLSNNILKLNKNQKYILTATIKLPNETNKNVIWSSDANSIATVDKTSGEITALDVGSANIIAVSEANSNVKDTCKLKVVVGVTNIALNKTEINLDYNTKTNLIVTVEPPDATEKEYTFTSDDINIATVDNSGVITALNKEGTTIIKVTSISDQTKFAICTVNVGLFIKKITLNDHTLKLGGDEKYVLNYILDPPNATNTKLIWNSNAPSIVSVLDGTITSGIINGTAKIYVNSFINPEIKDSCLVTVKVIIKGLTLSYNTLTLNKGEEKIITADVVPITITDKTVIWSSSDDNIASVTPDGGKITANSAGNVDIKATYASNNSIYSICKLTVIVPVESVTLDQDTIILDYGKFQNLVATVLPTDATDKSLKWTSSNPKINFINGVVYGTEVGNGFVYATASNGIKDSCFVKVLIKVTGINISQSVLKLNKNESKLLTAEILPTTATDKTIIWSSADETIATVTKDGLITAKKGGNVDIKATSGSDPSFYAICKLNVDVPVNSISLDKDTLILISGKESKTLVVTVLPTDAVDKTIVWSSNSGGFSVNNGVVSSLYMDEGYVYATASNGLKDSCKIIVVEYPELNFFKFEALKNEGMNSDVILSSYGTNGLGGSINYFAKVKLIPTFSATQGAIVKVNNEVQISGQTQQDFTSPVIYSIISKDGYIVYNYRVSINFINDSFDVTNGEVTCKNEFKQYITSVILADSMNGNLITSIGSSGFANCKNLTIGIHFPNTLKIIKSSAFLGCSFLSGSLNFPNSLTIIEDLAFYNCSNIVGSLNLHNFFTDIGSGAFYNCSGLTGGLIIPNSLTKIKSQTFNFCSRLNGNLVIPNTIKTIENNAFASCSSLTGVLTIPESVVSLGDNAFANCINFSGNLTLPNYILRIGEKAFFKCTGMKGSLFLPQFLKELGVSAFEGCNFTGQLGFSDSLKAIPDRAFYGCSGFTGNLLFRDSLTKIGNSSFQNCTGFSGNLSFSLYTTSIGSNAFQNCSGFTGLLTLGEKLLNIGDNAFENCTGFYSISYFKNITTLGNDVFKGIDPNLIVLKY